VPRTKMKKVFAPWGALVLIGALLLTASCIRVTIEPVSQKPKPPKTRVETVIDTLHGQLVEDPYRWLENRDSEEVQKWLDAQNAYTRSILDKLPGRERIGERLDQLLSIGWIGAPRIRKGKYFYEKREGKQNQAILYVRDGLEAEERVLIDPNVLSEEGMVVLDWWYPSEDGKLLVYGLSSEGTEMSTLYVMDVETGEKLPDQIERTRYSSIAWEKDNSGFYYTKYPKPGEVPEGEENYHSHVFHHTLGTDPTNDPKIFGEGRDMTNFYDVVFSNDGHYLLMIVWKGWDKSDMYYRDLQNSKEFIPIVQGIDAIFMGEIVEDYLYVLTNYNASKYRVFKVNMKNPSMENWQEIIPEGESVIQVTSVIGNKLFVQYLEKAHTQLKIFSLDGKYFQDIELPTMGSIDGFSGEWDGTEAVLVFHSFFIPPTIYHYDLKTNKLTLYERVESDIDTSPYHVEQVWYKSKDGTPISMFLIHKKGLTLDGNNPTVLTGYGGFNSSQTPYFARNHFLWLETGGVLAIPNLRGGGEYGEEWHKAGMLGNKQNVFDDFIAAAEWLISEGYTNPSRLAISGGSNGGLLVGAAMTQRPDLFKAVICWGPLLDMIRYHNFLIAKLWIAEYGSPDDPEQFKWLYAYSPYHRVKNGTAYPATLLLHGASDTRVDPMHAMKMVARLQAATSANNPILLRFETKAGHAGTPLSKTIEEYTDRWSFVYWQLGVKY
jgi:prolyl oligopeptidase